MSVRVGNYRLRDAEHTVLYRVIDEHFDVFLETARRTRTGPGSPHSSSKSSGTS